MDKAFETMQEFEYELIRDEKRNAEWSSREVERERSVKHWAGRVKSGRGTSARRRTSEKRRERTKNDNRDGVSDQSQVTRRQKGRLR